MTLAARRGKMMCRWRIEFTADDVHTMRANGGGKHNPRATCKASSTERRVTQEQTLHRFKSGKGINTCRQTMPQK